MTIRTGKTTLAVLLAALVIPSICPAGDFHGKIVKSRGEVLIRSQNGEERTPEVSDYIAVTDEEINTHEGGRAVVTFTNGSVTVIGENSRLGIEKPTLFAQLKGKILFAFARDTGPTRMVRAPSAVFGVRATSFVVDAGEDGDTLSLKEGKVHVEAPQGAFEIHRKTEEDELSAFKAEMEKGVADMKQEGDAFIQKEKDDYVAFKKSFLLEADQVIRIRGNRVDQRGMAPSDKAVFEDLEGFAGEFLDAYRHDAPEGAQ
ncbi:hypothetical protein JCM14469_17560 [Desulfatiferula olefinivorans]